MTTQLRVYLMHADDATRALVMANLVLLGHKVELTTASPAVMLRRCEENSPDIAIVGTDFRESNPGSLVNEICERSVCPVIVFFTHDEIDRFERLKNNDVLGVITLPANERDWRPAIHLAKRRFDQAQAMISEVERLTHELELLNDRFSPEEDF